LREHLDDAVVAWFEKVAWQHRTSADTRRVRATELEVPVWYGDADPLASLPAAERAELLDWLQVMVGLPPRDTTQRFNGLSRKQIGEFLSFVCQYEMLQGDDDLGFDMGMDREMTAESLAVYNEELKKLVSRMTNGRTPDFDYTDRRKTRKVDKTRQEMAREAAKRTDDVDQQQEQLRGMYSKYLNPYLMSVVAELFGSEAGTDPILDLFSLCTSGAPLARVGDKYKALFRVAQGTISHEPEFARAFAAETGAHSECVARRLARHMHEEGRALQAYERKNWPETVDYLEAMSAYKVPCPSTQEQELRERLDTTDAVPIYESWAAGSRRILQASETDDAEEIGDIIAEAGEFRPAKPVRVQTGFAKNATHRRAKAARAFLPNPILLTMLGLAMRERRR
jgi:hypothetical protein